VRLRGHACRRPAGDLLVPCCCPCCAMTMAPVDHALPVVMHVLSLQLARLSRGAGGGT
jgi:hypothetical protein